MHFRFVRSFAIGVFSVGAVTMADAQQNMPPDQSADLGKSEYEAHCVF